MLASCWAVCPSSNHPVRTRYGAVSVFAFAGQALNCTVVTCAFRSLFLVVLRRLLYCSASCPSISGPPNTLDVDAFPLSLCCLLSFSLSKAIHSSLLAWPCFLALLLDPTLPSSMHGVWWPNAVPALVAMTPEQTTNAALQLVPIAMLHHDLGSQLYMPILIG